MRTFLTTTCLAVLTVMLYVTISASLQQDLISATRQLWPDLWFRATLADTYCGFLFFWLWVVAAGCAGRFSSKQVRPAG